MGFDGNLSTLGKREAYSRTACRTFDTVIPEAMERSERLSGIYFLDPETSSG